MSVEKENYLLPFINHELDGNTINQRAVDGYVNATALCKACGKLFADYFRLNTTKEFLLELEGSMGIPIDVLIQKIKGGLNEFRGTWVHPQVAINLAQWASPKFAVFVSKWVLEWFDGSNKRNYRLPYHLRRFLINNEKIPYTHFSVLNEMTHMLLAPLENYGYELPMSLMPDISMGKLFSKWCRDKGLDPSTFPTYEHVFDDGRRPPVMARLYPIDLLADFKRFFHNVWVKERSIKYFEEKDPDAIEPMKKYLLLLETDFKEYILIDNSENKI